MPRLVHRAPKYRKHRASGQAFVKIDGKSVYLGPHGTRASRNEFDRVIGEWMINGRRAPALNAGVIVKELIASFWLHAENHYLQPRPGTRSSELQNFREALLPLKRLYGDTAAAAFGPLGS